MYYFKISDFSIAINLDEGFLVMDNPLAKARVALEDIKSIDIENLEDKFSGFLGERAYVLALETVDFDMDIHFEKEELTKVIGIIDMITTHMEPEISDEERLSYADYRKAKSESATQEDIGSEIERMMDEFFSAIVESFEGDDKKDEDELEVFILNDNQHIVFDGSFHFVNGREVYESKLEDTQFVELAHNHYLLINKVEGMLAKVSFDEEEELNKFLTFVKSL